MVLNLDPGHATAVVLSSSSAILDSHKVRSVSCVFALFICYFNDKPEKTGNTRLALSKSIKEHSFTNLEKLCQISACSWAIF